MESFNGVLKQMLKKLCMEEPKRWHKCIDPLLFAYREVPQESTGFSPFELLYGRPVRGPLNVLEKLWTEEETTKELRDSYEYVMDLQKRLEETM